MKARQSRNKNKDKVLRAVRESISEASSLLRNLGGEHERVAWLLEDSLMYLDEIGTEDLSLPQAAKLFIELPEERARAEQAS
jgi:hypothetical protein